MLDLKNIDFVINGRKLLDDVTCEFHPGKINIIAGPNGAGKSTMIKLLAGDIFPTEGTCTFNGKDLRAFRLSELARFRAVLSQSVDINFPLLVNEIVMMGRYPHFNDQPRKADFEACAAAMDFFELQDFVSRQYQTLSGGEKQRVHFARVYAQLHPFDAENKKILLLDEPLTFLDIRFQLDFMNKMRTLIKDSGLLLVAVLHDLNLCAAYADHLVLLKNAKLYASGESAEIFSETNILDVFGVQSRIEKGPEGLRIVF